MTPVLVTGPAVEPVSLADMKAHLRIDDDEQDDLIASLVTAARLMVEACSGRLLISQTWRLVLDAWPRDRVVRVPLGPLAGLSSVTVADANGTPQAWPLADFTVDALSDPGRIVAAVPPAPGLSVGGLALDVTLGYGPVPEDVPMPLSLAVRRLATRWFEQRGDGTEPDGPTLPAEIAVLLAPYRRVRV